MACFLENNFPDSYANNVGCCCLFDCGFFHLLCKPSYKADRRNLEILKNNGLKYVLTRTVGFDHVDLEAVKEFGLESARVPGYSPNAISELAVTLSMMLLRHTAYTVNRTREKNFLVDPFMFSKEIRNCTVAVLGAGKIGLTTAKLFKGLGARVIAYDVFQSDAAKEIVEFMELDEVLAQADIISVHMPYIKDVNYHMINDDQNVVIYLLCPLFYLK